MNADETQPTGSSPNTADMRHQRRARTEMPYREKNEKTGSRKAALKTVVERNTACSATRTGARIFRSSHMTASAKDTIDNRTKLSQSARAGHAGDD